MFAASIVIGVQHRTPAVEAFANELQTRRSQDQVRLVELPALRTTSLSPNDRLITLDQATLDWRFNLSTTTPTLAMRVRSEEVSNWPVTSSISALVTDPPLSRQLILATLLQPNVRRVGLLHEENFMLNDKLLATAEKLKIELLPVSWSHHPQRRALTYALKHSDILLGIDNERLYNGSTIKNILLTSYGHSRALIGPNLSFVAAGSLASTYSDQDDWLQTLDKLLDLAPSQWPKLVYPEDFKVRTNLQVARALGLALPTPEKLHAQILEWEQAQ